MRLLTPASISFLSCGVSGHGYSDARKLEKYNTLKSRVGQAAQTEWKHNSDALDIVLVFNTVVSRRF